MQLTFAIETSRPCGANFRLATQTGVESVSTIQFDPLGWKGAKLDITAGAERTSVRDPLTNGKRPISGTMDRWGLSYAPA